MRKKEAQQKTADIVHAAFWSFCERELGNYNMVDINNFCAKFAALNHISGPLPMAKCYRLKSLQLLSK